ncbi:right-handed parallel beta-helix repeat-containing protein [Candidatus Poribacteria bacterium]
MAIVVQKSTGNLSTLVSTNEFYATVASGKKCPTNNAWATINGSGSPTYINFTPSAAQDIKGVVLGLYNAQGDGNTARSRAITVELQENSGGWTTRLTQTIDTDDLIPDNTWSLVHGLFDVRFSSTYTLTAAAGTWRLKIYHDGTGSGTWYLMRSENSGDDNIFHIVYSDTIASLTSSDVLVLTDKITMDQSLSLEKVDAQSGSQNGISTRSRYYSIYACIPDTNTGTTPQIYVPSGAAGDYTLTLKGCFFLSSYGKGLLVGEDADNPLPSARMFTVDFSDTSSTNQSGFKAGTISSAAYGKLAGIELWGTKPNTMYAALASDALASQADVVVEGDVTSNWSNNDYLEVGGAQYSSGQMYRDYCYNEYGQIQSMSYAAGPDETTVTLTGNLSYNHYYQSAAIPVYISYCDRNILVKGVDGAYTQEVYTDIRGGYIRAQGVEFQNIYYNYIAYNYTRERSDAQKNDSGSLFDGCHFHDCTYPVYLAQAQCSSQVRNCTDSSSGTGTSLTPYAVYLTGARGVTVQNNVFQGRAYSGVYMSSGYGHIITGNYFNVQYGLMLYNRADTITVNSNTFFRCRVGVFFAGCGSVNGNGNTFRKCYYNGNYGAATESSHGCYCFSSPNGNVYTEDDDADDSFAFIVGQADAGIVHAVKNANLGATFADGAVSESGATYRPSWLPETEIKFEDYDQTDGDCRAWFTNGYIRSTGTGLADTTGRTTGAGMKAWRFEPYWTNEALELKLATPIGVANEPITVSVFCKLNHLNYAAGTCIAPKLEISGCGMAGGTLTASADVTTTDWQLLTVSGTPTSVGQIAIILSIETDASGSDTYVYWDDMYVSYKTPVDLGALDHVYHGLPISPPISTVMTAQNVWAEQMSDNRIVGSMGEAMRDIKWRSK